MLDYETKTATIIIAMSGEYDAANSQRILDRVTVALRWHGIDQITLDMSQVTFVDSTALSALIAAHKMCLPQGKQLTIRNPSLAVERLLRITSTERIFR